jgi:hypothetical protein
MAKKKKSIPSKLQIWLEVRQKYRLTDAQIQMARELGLNPRKFGGYANDRLEPWKRPLGEFIEEIYFKRFKKNEPERVLSIEEQAEEIRRKQAEKKERKRLKRAAEIEPSPGKASRQSDEQQAQK